MNSPRPSSLYSGPRPTNPKSHNEWTTKRVPLNYAELDSRNTIDELTEYPQQWNELLGRVFADYGLVISGWSGEWDKALVRALQSAPRRYPMYWDSRSSKGEVAQQVLGVHQGHTIQAESADELFADLAASIEALDRLSEPPLTTAMAIARLKRCLHDPVRRIELHDLVMGSATAIADAVAELSANTATYEAIDERLRALLASTTPLLHLLIEGVHHDQDGTHTQLWIDVLQRLLDARVNAQGVAIVIRLQHYPALLALRTMSVVALNRGREDLVIRLLTAPEWNNPARDNASPLAAEVLHLQVVLGGWINQLPRWGGTVWQYPESHLLRVDLEPVFADYLTGLDRYRTLSDDTEYLTGLVQEFRQRPGSLRANSGEFVGELGWDYGDPRVPYSELRFRARLSAHGPWPGLIPSGEWDDAYLDDYRETLKRHIRYA